MKKLLLVLIVAAFLFLVAPVFADQPTDKGFDQYGYNNTARNFVGTCLSWGQGKYGWTPEYAQSWCGPYYNDQIVMKWNAAWDACNETDGNDPIACAGAWTNNEWNGMSGGSGAVWHYKIVWIPESCGADYTRLKNGGECIWGHYEMIMDQGLDSNYGLGDGHLMLGLANPAGYGAYK